MMYIFSDTSINTTKSLAVGCYYFTNDLSDVIDMNEIHHIVFESASSTIAEMTTIKHILENNICMNSTLYTDCKNFVDLVSVRQYDEKILHHRNYDFYKEIIDLINLNNVKVIWVKGHSKKELKTSNYDKIFSVIDKRTRKMTRRLRRRIY